MVGLADFDHRRQLLRLQLVGLQVVADLFARVGVELAGFGLQEEQRRDVDPAGVDGFGVHAGCVVCHPRPVAVALADRQLEFLILYFNLNLHSYYYNIGVWETANRWPTSDSCLNESAAALKQSQIQR